jgi:uncharacterized alkaline shock family protein YloU
VLCCQDYEQAQSATKRANVTTNRILDQGKRLIILQRAAMTEEHTPIGIVRVAPRAIATTAYHAARESYGVVGLASKNVMDGLAQALVKDPTHGIEIHYDNDEVRIDVFVIIEYGTRIKSVAASVANTVRYKVEKTFGMPVSEVNVHVRGLRISDLD